MLGDQRAEINGGRKGRAVNEGKGTIDWLYLRGLLCTGLKQLPSAINAMLLPDAWELLEHWNDWPPEHVLLRGFTGYKPPAKELGAEEVSALTGMLGPTECPPKHINDLVAWAEQMKGKLPRA